MSRPEQNVPRPEYICFNLNSTTGIKGSACTATTQSTFAYIFHQRIKNPAVWRPYSRVKIHYLSIRSYVTTQLKTVTHYLKTLLLYQTNILFTTLSSTNREDYSTRIQPQPSHFQQKSLPQVYLSNLHGFHRFQSQHIRML